MTQIFSDHERYGLKNSNPYMIFLCHAGPCYRVGPILPTSRRNLGVVASDCRMPWALTSNFNKMLFLNENLDGGGGDNLIGGQHSALLELPMNVS